ncbi:hypothetical protein Tco_1367799 [Tanacetum coccineum]
MDEWADAIVAVEGMVGVDLRLFGNGVDIRWVDNHVGSENESATVVTILHSGWEFTPSWAVEIRLDFSYSGGKPARFPSSLLASEVDLSTSEACALTALCSLTYDLFFLPAGLRLLPESLWDTSAMMATFHSNDSIVDLTKIAQGTEPGNERDYRGRALRKVVPCCRSEFMEQDPRRRPDAAGTPRFISCLALEVTPLDPIKRQVG